MYWLDNNTGIPTAPTIPPVVSVNKRYFTNGGAGVQPSTPEDFWFHMIQEELLGVLTMAGIAPVKDDLGQLAKAIQSIAFSAYPVGAPIPWPTAEPPSGFLAMTGQSFSSVTYPKLAQAYPSLVLPDMRAEFIRGLDNGRMVDAGRTPLSSQKATAVEQFGLIGTSGGQYRIHTRAAADIPLNNIASFATTDYDSREATVGTGAYPAGDLLTPSGTVAPSLFRVRPRNIAFNYIVRAL